MTPNQRPNSEERGLKLWLREKAVYGWTIASGMIGVGGLWVDELGVLLKVLLCIIIAALALVSFRGFIWRAQREKSESARAAEAEKEVKRLRAKLEESAPDRVLDTVGSVLFVKPGAWRLTLFVLEQKGERSWCLEPLITRASSEVYEAAPHVRISLASGPLREVLDVDVSDPLRPYANESSNLPDRTVDPQLWSDLNSRITQQPSDALGMATRKFGWTAVKEPSSRRTFLLLSESVFADGIHSDVVRSQLLAANIVLVSRMVDVSYDWPGATTEKDTVLAEAVG